jgi:hypothetical protein
LTHQEADALLVALFALSETVYIQAMLPFMPGSGSARLRH